MRDKYKNTHTPPACLSFYHPCRNNFVPGCAEIKHVDGDAIFSYWLCAFPSPLQSDKRLPRSLNNNANRTNTPEKAIG